MSAAEGADPAEVDRLAEIAHDAYELSAAASGWETNPRSRYPWQRVPESNREATRAMVRAVLAAQQQPAGDDRGGHWEYAPAFRGDEGAVAWLGHHGTAARASQAARDRGHDCRVIRRWVGGWQEDA